MGKIISTINALPLSEKYEFEGISARTILEWAQAFRRPCLLPFFGHGTHAQGMLGFFSRVVYEFIAIQ